jgi:holo-[acyl-carrier protein] synthase|tara:strand:+ start:324 stop:707 length:384 start_codon:yes stop_codon:yes gene_type:complete
MKLAGIGVDIIENSRIKKLLKNKLFVDRVFSKKEILISKNKKDKNLYFAKRFAAKEAFSKSIGTGFRNGINLKDISVINDSLGKPSFLLNKRLIKLLKKKFNVKSANFLLSISDEKKYSIAFVVYQK